MSVRLWIGWAAVVALLSLEGGAQGRQRPAAADPTQQPDKAPAKGKARRPTLQQQGEAALLSKDLAAARTALEGAFRQAPGPEGLLWLGRLAAAEGRTEAAADLMRRYLADPARLPDEAAVKEAEAVAVRISLRSGSVSPLGASGAMLLVDGRLAGALPLSMPLQLLAGEHTLTLELPGRSLETPVPVQTSRLIEVRFNRGSGEVLLSLQPALLLFAEARGVKPTNSAPSAAGPASSAASALSGVRAALDEAARAVQRTVVVSEALTEVPPELSDCLRTAPCQRRLAQAAKIDYVLRQKIVAEGTRWDIELSLYHADVPLAAAKRKARCDSCTEVQAVQRLRAEADQLLKEGLGRARATLTVTTDPAGSQVTVGDEVAAPAPVEMAVWAGPLRLSARSPGHQAVTRELEVQAGQPLAVNLELPAELALTSRTQNPPMLRRVVQAPRPRWRLALGGVTIGAGALLVGLGVAGMRKDGDCVPDDTPCRQMYDTGTVGIGSIATGAALMIGGGVLIAVPGPRREIGDAPIALGTPH